jgi:hypothetical protein
MRTEGRTAKERKISPARVDKEAIDRWRDEAGGREMMERGE